MSKKKEIIPRKKARYYRPYKPEDCDTVLEVMAKGYSFEAVAGHLKISKKTLYNWREKHPEFAEACELGLELSRIWWEQKGIDHVCNKPTGFNLNTQSWIFNIKNRFGWKDKQEVVGS